MKITININYNANWGEELCIAYSHSPSENANTIIPMRCARVSGWSVCLEMKNKSTLRYAFLVRDRAKNVVRKEWGEHVVAIDSVSDHVINALWQDEPDSTFLSSPFKNCFFAHFSKKAKTKEKGKLLKVRCFAVESHQAVAVFGDGDLGNWEASGAIHLSPTEYGLWEVVLPVQDSTIEYKFAIIDSRTSEVERWESGGNRVLLPSGGSVVEVEEFVFREKNFRWKCAGVAIPVFSLKTENSFGVGEFSDLRQMVDWTILTGLRIIQVLPINDTSMSGTWKDSYPYNAISIYALHPIYLGLHDFPLRDKKRMKFYREEGRKLNSLEKLDYEQVIKLKRAYIHELFIEKEDGLSSDEGFLSFVSSNDEWLFPYACFNYFRDKYNTANYRDWKQFAVYNEAKLKKLLAKDIAFDIYVKEIYFTQYLLQKQLKAVRQYAINKGVVLKGDIPIGISRDSVEAWVEPHLFNLDTQTGAPPDDFAVEGQNWGFPTYNWDEMSKDGYRWWIKRFRKMAEFFDVYRIDHILGFFRIWEIPLDAVQGLLGHFSPALPLGIDEIHARGLFLTEERKTTPYIDANLVQNLFGERGEYVIETYLDRIETDFFQLKESVNSQRKIQELSDDESIKTGLYALSSNVLFIRDKKEANKLHPRISAQQTYSYEKLSSNEKQAFDSLYEDFFFHRHSEFWKDEAMKKLPALISSTDMLVCGEDLGMIPASVPEVMENLNILSLEIQRMPKTFGVQFEDLSQIPRKSVCATSTHDMAPIRLWWKEDRNKTQYYYNHILHKEGQAPVACSPKLCQEILELHLQSPAMLSIHPLQDWLSMDALLRRENEAEEQINVPANPNHCWQYRMHLTLENLVAEDEFNTRISETMLKMKRVCNEIKKIASSMQSNN